MVLRPLLAPRMLGLHVLAVLAVTAATLLGLWQYHAWQIHREDRTLALATAPAKPLQDVISADAAFPGDAVGQPVSFSGRWLTHDTFYVSDRPLDGRTGFWVVTPLAVCPGGSCADASALLVVRGWSTRPDGPQPPSGPIALTGWLQPPEGAGITDQDRTDDVLPELRMADAVQRVDRDLYGAYVIADRMSPSVGGLQPVTPESLPEPSSFTGLRNLLYALEWWLFGGFAVFIWVRWCTDEVRGGRPGTDDPEPVDGPEAGTPSPNDAAVASGS